MNRFYLFISIFLIQYIGFSQCDFTLDLDSEFTFPCIELSSNQARLKVIGSAPGAPDGPVIWQCVPEAFDIQEVQGTLDAKIYFDAPGTYQITMISPLENCTVTKSFTVNPLPPEPQVEIDPSYYLCDGSLSINAEIINDDDYTNSSISYKSYNEYPNSTSNELINFTSPDTLYEFRCNYFT